MCRCDDRTEKKIAGIHRYLLVFLEISQSRTSAIFTARIPPKSLPFNPPLSRLRLRTGANRVLGCKICTRFQVANASRCHLRESLARLCEYGRKPWGVDEAVFTTEENIFFPVPIRALCSKNSTPYWRSSSCLATRNLMPTRCICAAQGDMPGLHCLAIAIGVLRFLPLGAFLCLRHRVGIARSCC